MDYSGIDIHFMAPYMSIDENLPYGDNLETLKSFIEERTNAQEFRSMLDKRDSLKTLVREHNDRIKKLRDDRKTTEVQIRDAVLGARPVFEEYTAIRNRINQWRAPAAAAALVASQIRDKMDKESGAFIEYTDSQIGDLKSLGEFEIGSPEWHNARNAGIGGSDVGRIMKAGDAEYAREENRACLMEKVGLSVPEEQDRYDFTTAIGRGCAWEEYIRQMFTDLHPELNVAFCKTSWAGTGLDAYRHANFDGLILDDHGVPEGVLEIKTGTVDAHKWGPSGEITPDIPLEDTGEEFNSPGVPAPYLLQVLWYAMNAGLKYGILIAVLDDHDVREYRINVSPDLPNSFASVCDTIDNSTESFWAIVEKHKENLAKGVNNIQKVRKGFAKSTTWKAASKWLAPFLDVDQGTSDALAKDIYYSAKGGLSVKEFDASEVFGELFFNYAEKFRERPFIGVDLETNHLATKFGRIIESGVVRLDTDGEITCLVDQLHGIPDVAMAGAGTGMVDVHRITPEMIQGMPLFEEPQFQKDLLEMLTSGVMVAHNAGFEKQWLSINLNGFAEALGSGGVRILDTRMLTEKFILDAPDNKLQSFAEYNGIPYEGAHAAAQDTIIMMRALWRFLNCVTEHGKFIPLHPTDEQRKKEASQVIR